MQNAQNQPRLTRTDWSIVLGIGILAVLCAAPGVHLFALWLAPLPAMLTSHGLALVGLGIAGWQWHSRRRRTTLQVEAV
jgi:hypothetical protein